ncbi:MAG TPA: HD-GYP domain-containing protein [Planctomycetaceae bacterium]|nr:HD-GYP domain-containing protein [Planctomycetaceae bacterium]
MVPTELNCPPTITSRSFKLDSTRGVLPPAISQLLDRAFGVPMAVVNGQSGQLLHVPPNQPARDWLSRAELCRQVADRGTAEIVEEEDPLVVLAMPILELPGGEIPVAVATLVTRPVAANESLDAASAILGMSSEAALDWVRSQPVWPVEMIQRVTELTMERLAVHRRVEALDRETRSLSANLSSTYEEISLLYRLTQNLKLSAGDEALGEIALEGLEEVVPAEGLALVLLPVVDKDEAVSQPARSEEVLLTRGDCPIDARQLDDLIARLKLHARSRPFVANPPVTQDPSWPLPQARQLIVVPLAEGDNLFGWLAAVNHRRGGEFGTVEANLMNSVATILGIQSGNIELYRQQSEMFAGVVRAMVSAIDAKDPYTRGHSDRVAQASLCLARELGCDQDALNSIYLSGLLHDIGKIGIDDNVLRKPGRLSEQEYEHIKSHVTVGHWILKDLKKMDEVLPVVLYHHEAWAGGGYPRDLQGESIPVTARIVAVADAFDAMSSDRPYRKGLPDEKIDAIFHDGAGKQWDPAVVDVFFRIRDTLREISHHARNAAEGKSTVDSRC